MKSYEEYIRILEVKRTLLGYTRKYKIKGGVQIVKVKGRLLLKFTLSDDITNIWLNPKYDIITDFRPY